MLVVFSRREKKRKDKCYSKVMDINKTNPVTSASTLKSSSNTTISTNATNATCYPSPPAPSAQPPTSALYEYTNEGLLIPRTYLPTTTTTATCLATTGASHKQQQQQQESAMEYYYENQGCTNQQNCFMFSTMSYPYIQQNNPAASQDNCVYYQLINNVQGYRWAMPTAAKNLPATTYFSNTGGTASRWATTNGSSAEYADYAKDFDADAGEYYAMESQQYCKGDSSIVEKSVTECESDGSNVRPRVSNKMHPVQLLHQIFRKEAFVMEYERINDGPFSQVRVTYKVNGKTYTAEATRLKEARRLCAKLVLRDQFPDLKIEVDNDIPQPEYDVKQFDNKHPVQILYQIFRYEPMEMHCEEEGAAHFAKHIFTFVIRGKKYIAKAETIKEAKRRAAILALNEYFKKEN